MGLGWVGFLVALTSIVIESLPVFVVAVKSLV